MKQWIGRIGIVMALSLVVYIAGHRSGAVVHAQQPISIPKAYGHCIGTMVQYLVLEDSAGTIRIVEPSNGQVQLTVTRN
jgi:hypothetical protein